MAVTTWSRELPTGSVSLDVTTPVSATASESTTLLTLPTMKMRYADYYWATGNGYLGLGCYYDGSSWNTRNTTVQIKRDSTVIANSTARSNVSGGVAGGQYGAMIWRSTPTVNTSAIFDANNATSKTVALKVVAPNGISGSASVKEQAIPSGYIWEQYAIGNDSDKTFATINVTLNAPPTFTAPTLTKNTDRKSVV